MCVQQGGKPPVDGAIIVRFHQFVSTPLYAAMATWALIGMLLTVFFLLFNIVYRNSRYLHYNCVFLFLQSFTFKRELNVKYILVHGLCIICKGLMQIEDHVVEHYIEDAENHAENRLNERSVVEAHTD